MPTTKHCKWETCSSYLRKKDPDVKFFPVPKPGTYFKDQDRVGIKHNVNDCQKCSLAQKWGNACSIEGFNLAFLSSSRSNYAVRGHRNTDACNSFGWHHCEHSYVRIAWSALTGSILKYIHKAFMLYSFGIIISQKIKQEFPANPSIHSVLVTAINLACLQKLIDYFFDVAKVVSSLSGACAIQSFYYPWVLSMTRRVVYAVGQSMRRTHPHICFGIKMRSARGGLLSVEIVIDSFDLGGNLVIGRKRPRPVFSL